MAARMYNGGMTGLLDGTFPFLTTVLKLMIVKSSYTFDPDHKFVSSLSEITGVSGYTGGYGGAGRKTVASKTVTQNDTADSCDVDFADVAYGALGTGDTIGGYVLIFETGGVDTTARTVSYWSVTATPTNGSTITAVLDAIGAWRNTSP